VKFTASSLLKSPDSCFATLAGGCARVRCQTRKSEPSTTPLRSASPSAVVAADLPKPLRHAAKSVRSTPPSLLKSLGIAGAVLACACCGASAGAFDCEDSGKNGRPSSLDASADNGAWRLPRPPLGSAPEVPTPLAEPLPPPLNQGAGASRSGAGSPVSFEISETTPSAPTSNCDTSCGPNAAPSPENGVADRDPR
jgi:hypothetical protein